MGFEKITFRGAIAIRYTHHVEGGANSSAVIASALGRRIGAMLTPGIEIAVATRTAAK